jgi:hypothetical protein
MLMTAGHEIAITGAIAYGTNVFASTFDPPCDAYRAAPKSQDQSTTSFAANSFGVLTEPASVSTLFSASLDAPFPLAFFKNVTNQPIFANGKTCDNMIRLFNTSLTTVPNRIENVKGTVRARIPPFDGEHEWNDVYGLRFDSAFIENNYLPCEDFRGYSGRD